MDQEIDTLFLIKPKQIIYLSTNFKGTRVTASFVQDLWVHDTVRINLLFVRPDCIAFSSQLIFKVLTCIAAVSTKIA